MKIIIIWNIMYENENNNDEIMKKIMKMNKIIMKNNEIIINDVIIMKNEK